MKTYPSEIPADVMLRIIEKCGQHTEYDPHYHCTHCGGAMNGMGSGHWNSDWSPICPEYVDKPTGADS